MSIEIQINESIKDSMKKKDILRLESLRSIKSAILLEKTKSSSDKILDENKIIKILQRLVKQRNDSAKIYNEQKREDLAKIEIAQSKIISEFLPEQINESELTEIINTTIIELKASSMKDMGDVISAVSKKVSGRAEGRIIAEIVKNILSN
tara:strand:- start:148 stop:600 length:453 start_codon:yes stop_codon:yes gene_type:complete